jgi:hypothetical protein
MAIDPAACRAWAREVKAAWEVTPLAEMERGCRVQVGFELTLYARIPTEVPPGEDREAAVVALWDRLREIAESLLPLVGADLQELGLKPRSW